MAGYLYMFYSVRDTPQAHQRYIVCCLVYVLAGLLAAPLACGLALWPTGPPTRGVPGKLKIHQTLVLPDCVWVARLHTFPLVSHDAVKKELWRLSLCCVFGGSRSMFFFCWKRCSPTTDLGGPDRRPGERVGRGICELKVFLNHLMPNGLV